jgi:hypothetical protein
MRYILTALATVSIGLACVSVADAAKKKAAMSMSRYAAIEACTAQARAQVASTNDEFQDGRNRSFAYVACMRSKGFTP